MVSCTIKKPASYQVRNLSLTYCKTVLNSKCIFDWQLLPVSDFFAEHFTHVMLIAQQQVQIRTGLHTEANVHYAYRQFLEGIKCDVGDGGASFFPLSRDCGGGASGRAIAFCMSWPGWNTGSNCGFFSSDNQTIEQSFLAGLFLITVSQNSVIIFTSLLFPILICKLINFNQKMNQ